MCGDNGWVAQNWYKYDEHVHNKFNQIPNDIAVTLAEHFLIAFLNLASVLV